MTTTTNLGITLVDVGQKEKEATINAAIVSLDNASKNIISPNISGTITLANATKISGGWGSGSTSPYFMSTTGNTFVYALSAQANSVADSRAGYVAYSSNDAGNNNMVSLSARNSSTLAAYIAWGSNVSAAAADPTIPFTFIGANTKTIYASIRPGSAPIAATDLTRKDYVDGRYKGEFATDPSTSGIAAGAMYYNTSVSKLKVLLSTGTWVNVA